MSDDLNLSRALHYGHGCFTTLVHRDGELLLWEYHWQRLHQACQVLGLYCEEDSLRQQLQQAINCQTEKLGIMKIMVLAKNEADGYVQPQSISTQIVILPRPLKLLWLAEKRQQGCHLFCCQYRLAHQPKLAGIKHLNRLDQVLASQELRMHAFTSQENQKIAYDDGVMLDIEDCVIETTCANMFFRIGKQWITPDLSLTGVTGVARSLIINWFKDSGALLGVRKIHWSEFCLVEEVFICNAVRGIWPVVRVQEKMLAIGDLTRNLQITLQLHFA